MRLATTIRFCRWAMAGICFVLVVSASPAFASPRVGEPAPNFTGVDTKGQAVKLNDYRGKTVVLEWTNHQCPFVGKHYRTGNMQALQKKAKDDGIIWLSVISSGPGRQGHVRPGEADKLTVSRGAAPTAVLLDPDGKIGHLYKARATPHMFVVNSDGDLVYKGAIDNKPSARDADVEIAKNYVSNALQLLAAGKPVYPSVTQVYGCSVKYGS